MTQEEKARAYEAVLQTAKQWIKDGCTDKERICLECVFPELRESEDERVRKMCITAVNIAASADGGLLHHEAKQCLDYLEKQKEPHYTKRNALFDKCVENCDPEVMEEVSDKVDEMLGKEQKPAEWSEEDEKNLGQVISGKYLPLGLREWFCGLPERFSSRPSWKPSEEQMEAFEDVMTCIPEFYKPKSNLASLLRDLKKLM